ncbi:MAG: carbohydrate porin [Deltaproteobacteria bacterium]|nr:carbohydrate porin [Deltaproteobacteria bacterium]
MLRLAVPFSVLLLSCGAGAQSISFADDQPAIFPHPAASPVWVSGQVNVIFQWHPEFRSHYSGPNSLQAESETATSYVTTLFTGYQLTPTTEVLLDVESTGGSGLSTALGVAGFTNLDVVRNPQLSSEPYIARLQVRQIIPLSDEYVDAERGPLSLATRLPLRRLELRAGKLSVVDFFDVNRVGSDSHTQFMNWTIDNNGAYDYSADTRGYTYGLILEYDDRLWALRFAEALMPKVANGIDVDWNVARARGESFELELRPELVAQRPTVVRLLSYVNHADMGNYREANAAFLSGADRLPDITAHRRQGNVKYGFGVGLEQPISSDLAAFARAGWNEGLHESFAYTEVDASGACGLSLAGNGWARPADKVGVAGVVNAISDQHRRYLALGGQGFLLGDGALSYDTEQILEGYYTLHVWRGISVRSTCSTFETLATTATAAPSSCRDFASIATFDTTLPARTSIESMSVLHPACIAVGGSVYSGAESEWMNRRRIVLGVLIVALASCSREPAMVAQLRKERLITLLQQRLLESAEAEKSAVLATTDDESQALVREAQASAAAINELRGELRVLIVADKRHDEVEKLDAFDSAWAESEEVDKRLLALAVENTNLKASRLSAREGAAAVERFVDALDELQRAASDPETIRALAHASLAALREQTLLLVHIPTAEPSEMTRLEQEMSAARAESERSLASARKSGQLAPENLAKAATAWEEYRRVAGEVVRLSRQNTNVLSFDLSVHEKRKATKECLSALARLLAAVQSTSPATR